MTAGVVSVVVSAAALAISLSTFVANRWRDKRDLFLRVHERLVAAEQQQARRLLHGLAEQGKRVEDYTDDEYALVNNALAALDVLGIYYKRRYVRRRDVLEIWATPILRLMPAAEPFLAHRDSLGEGGRTWPALRALTADAEKFLRHSGQWAAVLRQPIGDPAQHDAIREHPA
jgi:hypothetical protein